MNKREQYIKELLILQKLIRFRRHELYIEDEAPILKSLLVDVEPALELSVQINDKKGVTT